MAGAAAFPYRSLIVLLLCPASGLLVAARRSSDRSTCCHLVERQGTTLLSLRRLLTWGLERLPLQPSFSLHLLIHFSLLFLPKGQSKIWVGVLIHWPLHMLFFPMAPDMRPG